MDETRIIDGLALSMQMGTAVYALRLNRLFGTDRAGWALFGAFALMLAIHVSEGWAQPTPYLAEVPRNQLVYLISSVLLLIGLSHVNMLFRERLHREGVICRSRDELKQRVEERTRDLAASNARLQSEVDERVRVQSEISASRARYRELVDSLSCVVFEAELPDLRFTFVSSQCERLLGFSPEEWLTRRWRDIVHRDHADTVAECDLSNMTGVNSTIEFPTATADGRVVWLRQVGTVVAENGVAAKLRGVLLDITERRNMEMQLRQAQKLESVSRLAGGVAHDFNNILTIIHGHAELLLTLEELHAPAISFVGEIKSAAERAAQLTSQLLALGCGGAIQPQAVDLNALVSTVAERLPGVVGQRMLIRTEFACSPAVVRADPALVEQVLTILALNAREAAGEGGELTIQTLPSATSNDASAGLYGCIQVRDNGCGIAPEILPRIFEPFFTTKGIGRGSGLGLATAYGIVQRHQGWITVNSTVGGGSTFQIYLPTVSEPASPPVAKIGAQVAGGAETILVVDDEPALRELVCNVLGTHGYHVLQASSGVAALEVWKDNCDSIDLLMTDIVMPGGINGWQLAEQLRAHKPGLKVICASGYVPEEILRNGSRHRMISKPYDIRDLARAVREVLDTEQEPV